MWSLFAGYASPPFYYVPLELLNVGPSVNLISSRSAFALVSLASNINSTDILLLQKWTYTIFMLRHKILYQLRFLHSVYRNQFLLTNSLANWTVNSQKLTKLSLLEL